MKRNRGTTSLELALLFPMLVAIYFSLVQILIFIQASSVTQYAAFLAARSYQVYGERTLSSVNYPHVLEYPHTNEDQSIAEATAEKVIFESLMWEQSKVVVKGKDPSSLDRVYKDGNDLSINSASLVRSEGVVRINLLTKSTEGKLEGAQVIYCLPIVFPWIEKLFDLAKKESPCKTTRFGSNYSGLGIMKEVRMGKVPGEL